MADEHPHIHRLETECTGDDCDAKRTEQYSHVHPHGHDFHVHRPEGAQLVKVEEVTEEVKEPARSRSPLWDGPEGDAA